VKTLFLMNTAKTALTKQLVPWLKHTLIMARNNYTNRAIR